MKRDANYEDEDAMEDFNSWLGDGNAMEIGKRGGKSFLSLFLDITRQVWCSS